MFKPVKVVEIEISRALRDFHGLQEYDKLKALVRLHQIPIGFITLPILNGTCSKESIERAIVEEHGQIILEFMMGKGRCAPPNTGPLRLNHLIGPTPPVKMVALPLVTVAICTRDRPACLSRCLEAVRHLTYHNVDLLIIDNAPRDETTKHLVIENYPHVRYVREPRPGLNWARNRAILEAHGEIMAFTDDDVVVDSGWVDAIAGIFSQHPEVMALTGLVVPYELKTKAQVYFEEYGGYGRGFSQQWYSADPRHQMKDWHPIAVGRLGTGANMAFRKSVFDQVGLFDPAFDVGTVTEGGGDLDMFFRTIQGGFPLVYEPKAIVHHQHRQEYKELQRQIHSWGIAFSAYLLKSVLTCPRNHWAIIRFTIWHMCARNIPGLFFNLLRSPHFPRGLMWARLRGLLIGPIRYLRAKRDRGKIEAAFGPLMPAPTGANEAFPLHGTRINHPENNGIFVKGHPDSCIQDSFVPLTKVKTTIASGHLQQ